ncbi:MAG: SDR family NAD(P)-dependent oxidoreductase, partial [Thermoplasmata archaeon]
VPGSGAELALSYHSLVGLAAALDGSLDAAPVRVIVATIGAESVLDEAVDFPERALVRGPVLSLPAEVPWLRMRSVDFQPADGAAAVDVAARELVDEAANSDGENMVARRGRRRWVRRFERLALPASGAGSPPLKLRGVYLVTGGLGGIGLTVARWLAAQTSARLLLTGRTAMPDRREWDAWLDSHAAGDRASAAIRAIRDVENAGGEVLVAIADAADPVAMSSAIQSARARWGAIDGVVHAAGIPGDGRIAFLKDPASISSVLAPKMGGLAVLVELLGNVPLDFVVLLSSINSLLGAPGLADYSSANAVLDSFVDSARRPTQWRQVTAINYAQWREVGMASRLFESGVARRRAVNDGSRPFSMSPSEGIEAFARALASGRNQVVVFPHDLSRIMELVRAHAAGSMPLATDVGAQPADDLPSVAPAEARSAVSTPYEPPGSDTERQLAGIWSELLGVSRIGMQDDFFELGGHSLLATRVLSRVQHTLGARLTLRDIFDAPTIRTLADKVAAAGRAGSLSSGAKDDDRE